MSTLYRLKAYFGMVPSADLDAYVDDYHPDYGEPKCDPGYDGAGGYYEQRPGHAHPRSEHRFERPDRDQVDRHDDRRNRVPVASSVGGSGGARPTTVHGALAVDVSPESPRVPAPAPEPVEPVLAGRPRSLPLSRITTVHPRSYDEARTIGERYRDGIPVIINLTELEDAAAKRLVDFAAGLAFALRGSIDKVTSRVFLLSPSGVDVSAEDRRKLAERGFFGQG